MNWKRRNRFVNHRTHLKYKCVLKCVCSSVNIVTRHKRFCYTKKSCVKIGITKTFCYNNKMFSSINKTFGFCSKIFGCSNKNLFVVPNFVAVTKPFFPCNNLSIDVRLGTVTWSYTKLRCRKTIRISAGIPGRIDSSALLGTKITRRSSER